MSSFKAFKEAVSQHISSLVAVHPNLFVVDVSKEALWELYLGGFPSGTNPLYKERTEHDCNSCRSFIRQFGNVVAIGPDNELISIWDAPGLVHPYNAVASHLSAAIKAAPIRDVYLSAESKIGTDKNTDPNTLTTWNHLYCVVPRNMVVSRGVSVESVQGPFRDSKNVFKRSMDELTTDAGLTVLELIDQGTLYRGEEHKANVQAFLSNKHAYSEIAEDKRDAWCWVHSFNNPVARIRNTALGTLLIDLSAGVELDTAVRSFERVMAPTNYKRPQAIFTKKMVETAEQKLADLGLVDSLGRRFAVPEDLSVNDILFVNRDTRKRLKGSVFDELKDSIPVSAKALSKTDDVTIDEFLANILPHTQKLELLLEGRHQPNLMSVIAPQVKSAPSLFKWDNGYSWAYNGDIADSMMKQNVKNAGGNVEGVLRFSIQWNDDEYNGNDFDAHCIEPRCNEIYYGRKQNPSTTGALDVDIIMPRRGVAAVENITWTDISKMQEGVYKFFVRNFSHNGGRSGFKAEIEYGGEIYSYHYDKELKQSEDVVVAEIKFSRAEGITFIKSLDSSVHSKEVWGIKTQQLTPVSMMLLSPNHWEGQAPNGNKHYFFILDGCRNETQPRGFFNEFLRESLTPHRKVFEALGSRMRVEPSQQQLSGVGFSSTQRNHVIAKVEGNFTRQIKIHF